MKSLRVILMSVITAILSIAVIAQSADCPAIVQTALDSLDAVCAETGRNQACYGNTLIDLQAQADAQVESFDTPGDTVNLNDVETMKLAPLNEEADTWGVALMKLQANIPDTLPGQNVTFLLFGDVVIDNAVTEDEDGFTPMQAFYFRSGVGDAACAEAPESGLLIQTPEGVEEILLNVNGANMSLGSTAFLQAGQVPETEDQFELTVSVLEGQGMIEAYGDIQPIPAGSWVRIATDRHFNVIAPPNPPKPYQFAKHGQLPIRVLERVFDIHTSLTQEEVDQNIADFNPIQALRRFRERGAQLDRRTTIQNITNEHDEDVTVTIGDQTVTIAPDATEKIELPVGRYDLEICASVCITVADVRVFRPANRTIISQMFPD